MKFCVVVPMFNEEENVPLAALEINKVLNTYALDADILMIDDGSTDSTQAEIRKIQNQYSNVLLKVHRINQGFGAARRTAMQFIVEKGYDFGYFCDADLTGHPKYIKDFYEKIQQGYDFVTGSRYTKGGGMEEVPTHRVFISRVGSLISQICFRLPLTDYTQPLRAIKTSLIKKLTLTEPGWAVAIEEIWQTKKYTNKITEVPIILTNRKMGKSKFIYRPGVFYEYLKYPLKALLDF